MQEKTNWREAINATVLISGLGYFVDLFDIALFGVLRVPSLKDLGVTDPQAILEGGVQIYNSGMIGMMIGGILWGVLADKVGRISVLFGSILIYSIGSIANAFVWDVQSYAIVRLLTGIGLAGELGAAITLVSESLPKRSRGIGTTIVATMGLSGSIAAGFIGQLLHWKTAYIVGGIMGLCLLVARLKLIESGMFDKMKHSTAPRGDLRLFTKPQRLLRYIACILVGAPIYFITGILFTFSPEITKSLGIEGVGAGNAILYGSIGLALGDLGSGLLSQFLESRKKAVGICLGLALAMTLIYLNSSGGTPTYIYFLCFVAGFAAGYWAVVVTVAAEQFGTNIRGTVATTIPNFVRGSAVLTVTSFGYLKNHLSVPSAALTVGLAVFLFAFLSLNFLTETFGKDLEYVEER